MKIEKDTSQLDRLLQVDFTKPLKKTLVTIESKAKDNAPVDAGNLRDSISHEVNKAGEGAEGEVFATADYAPFVELGTSDTPAHPFLLPAVEESIPLLVDLITGLINGNPSGE